jgi:hypothetical protein
MESELPITHIVDGRRILFEARRGDHYEELPNDLLDRELRGLSFGDVGVDALTPLRGTVTVPEIESKRSTLVLKLRHDNGTENAVYVDFTRDAKEVSIEEAVEAVCWVVAPAAEAAVAERVTRY